MDKRYRTMGIDMKSRWICIISFLILLSGLLSYQNASAEKIVPIWVKTWGNNDNDNIQSIAVDSSSVYVAGATRIYGSGYKGLIQKYDANGNLLWTKTLNDSSVLHSLALFNSILYTGSSSYFLKFDLDGSLLLNTKWNGGNSMIVDNTGIYVVGVKTHYSESQVWIFKYDLNGKEIWNKTWGETMGYNYGYSIASDNSGIYITGQSSNDLLILKFDKSGNYVWNKTFSYADYDVGKSIVADSSGIYVTCDSSPPGTTHIVIIKINPDGNVLWEKTWISDTWGKGNSIALDNTDLYIAGFTKTTGAIYEEVLIIRYDKNGNFKWNKTWGGDGDYDAFSVLSDGTNIYVGGTTNTYGAGDTGDAFIMKYNAEGISTNHLLSGHIYISGTSNNIINARVTTNPGNYQTTTDIKGYYEFIVPDGNYTISVTASGYTTASVQVTISGTNTVKDIYMMVSSTTPSSSGGIDITIVGCILAIVIIVGIVIFAMLYRKKKQKQQYLKQPPSYYPPQYYPQMQQCSTPQPPQYYYPEQYQPPYQ